MQREGSIDSNVRTTFEHVLGAFDISIIVENRLEMRKLWPLKGRGRVEKMKKNKPPNTIKEKGDEELKINKSLNTTKIKG